MYIRKFGRDFLTMIINRLFCYYDIFIAILCKLFCYIILIIIFLIMQLYHDSSTTSSCLSRFLVILDMHISEEYSVHCYRPANTDISIFYVKIAIFYDFFSIFLYYRNPWLKIKPTKFVIRYFSCIFIFADYCSLCQTINNYISRIKH